MAHTAWFFDLPEHVRATVWRKVRKLQATDALAAMIERREEAMHVWNDSDTTLHFLIAPKKVLLVCVTLSPHDPGFGVQVTVSCQQLLDHVKVSLCPARDDSYCYVTFNTVRETCHFWKNDVMRKKTTITYSQHNLTKQALRLLLT